MAGCEAFSYNSFVALILPRSRRMISSTQMAAIIAEKLDDGKVYTTREAKAVLSALLSEEERDLKETNRHTGKPTGKRKFDHEFHTALNRLKTQGKLQRGEWGTFRIVSDSSAPGNSVAGTGSKGAAPEPVQAATAVKELCDRYGAETVIGFARLFAQRG
jgi:hypothetical protein